MFNFSDILEKKMKERGLSRQALSLAAGLERSAVRAIVEGRSNHPRVDTIWKLSQALDCSPLELLPPEWGLATEEIKKKG